jgi:hypothetical protein
MHASPIRAIRPNPDSLFFAVIRTSRGSLEHPNDTKAQIARIMVRFISGQLFRAFYARLPCLISYHTPDWRLWPYVET